jgi:hypothetical protein
MPLKIPSAALDASSSRSSAVPDTVPFNDLLVPHDRPVRLPLSRWAGKILDLISQSRNDSNLMDHCHGMMRSFNEAALIEVFAGRMEHAFALCEAAVTWTAWMTAETEQPMVAKFALHPFINLARLDRIHRRWDLALRKFRSLGDVLNRKEFVAAEIHITEDVWQKVLAEDPEFFLTIKTVYIVDILKTLLRAHRYDEALAFVKEFDVGADISLLDFLLEGAIIALCRSGKPVAAMQMIEGRLRESNRNMNRPVFLFRRAECFLLMNDLPQATALLEKMAAAFYDRSITLGMTKLSFLLQLAKLMRDVNPERAISLCEIGFEAAAILNDCVFQTEFLAIIRGADCGKLSQQARERMEQIARDSLYGAATNPALVQSHPFRTIDQLFHDLMKVRCRQVSAVLS